MKKAPIPEYEDTRLHIVQELGLLDTEHEERFDCIVAEAKNKLHVPMSTISIIDKDREWFKACYGMPCQEGPREISFCGHAMVAREMCIVEDTLKDERFMDNPYVTGLPYVRFYAGIALYHRSSGVPVGVFCVKDTKPRTLSLEELGVFTELACKAEDEINRPSRS